MKRTLQKFWYKLEYQMLRVKHTDRESIDLYRELQNRKIRYGEAYPRGLGIGIAQFEYLKRQGIQSDDSLLDIGCGDLRGGRYIIEYLNCSRYTGTDISPEAIRGGWNTILDNNLLYKNPELRVNKDLYFHELSKSYDIVFANSVLTHQPIAKIEDLFYSLPSLLNPSGVAHLSFNDKGELDRRITDAIYHSNSYEYPYEYLSDVASEYGITTEIDEYEEHPKEPMKMLVCRNK